MFKHLSEKLLISYFKDDMDILNEILSIYLQETPDKIKILQSAFDGNDVTGIIKTVHSLSNTTGTLRFTQLNQDAKTIEGLYKNGQQEEASMMVPPFINNVRESIAEIQQFQDQLGN